MGETFFPGEKPKAEKLINRFDGSLTERYKDEKGRIIEDHHKSGEKSPIISRDIYPSGKIDAANRETIFFKGSAGKEKTLLKKSL